MTTQTTKPTALDSFITKAGEFDALLQQLQQMRDDHFGVGPDAVTWGHVGDVTHYVTALKEVTDAYFKEGEYAE
jgi:hypothetical protein